MIFTQSNEKTALNFLAQNDWKLEVATDKFFQNPELYVPNIKGALDKRKLEQLYNRYRGVQLTYQCWEIIWFHCLHCSIHPICGSFKMVYLFIYLFILHPHL